MSVLKKIFGTKFDRDRKRLQPLVDEINRLESEYQLLSDEEILSGPDDEGAFSRILLSRIGSRPLLDEVECEVVTKDTPLLAWIDRDHFTDLLTYILEDLVGTGAGRIGIRIRKGEEGATITITGILAVTGARKPLTWRFLRGLAERAGGSLVVRQQDGLQSFEFTARAA